MSETSKPQGARQRDDRVGKCLTRVVSVYLALMGSLCLVLAFIGFAFEDGSRPIYPGESNGWWPLAANAVLGVASVIAALLLWRSARRDDG